MAQTLRRAGQHRLHGEAPENKPAGQRGVGYASRLVEKAAWPKHRKLCARLAGTWSEAALRCEPCGFNE
jgi:hypothetical protein